MNKDKATARPWKTRFNQSTNKPSLEIETREKYNQTILYFSNGQMAEENAKLIVKAVNMHDKLVNAVNDAFCLIGEALIDNSPTEEERETWSSLQDKLRELLLRSEKE